MSENLTGTKQYAEGVWAADATYHKKDLKESRGTEALTTCYGVEGEECEASIAWAYKVIGANSHHYVAIVGVSPKHKELHQDRPLGVPTEYRFVTENTFDDYLTYLKTSSALAYQRTEHNMNLGV